MRLKADFKAPNNSSIGARSPCAPGATRPGLRVVL